MKHLTVDEMIDFVSLTKLDADALMLSATVNEHIRDCDQCLRYVQAFQMIHDEFARLHGSDDFRKFVINKVRSANNGKNADLPLVASEKPTQQDEYDGYA